MSKNQVAGGHKAAINNDSVPEESKENSKRVLEEMEQSGEVEEDSGNKSKNENNVIGGHKATLKNPNVGEEAKEHSREVLKEHGVEVEEYSQSGEETFVRGT
ncbi:Conidiation protein 6-domain-containing protein [Kockovaella imperatae]|uniref:Conidiation protein 6-domain-containing protein n=1 Tax=Kockovaella imperatae TaxID=4999 RepID=A0A1Y1UQC5_9TREE|nr:Conidiation protein 6-domain-containing protein [Kockovaella imperatae]ORX40172.1 Conidiation protein 6-domain-containing protein [Kockovaella imperatae]